MALRRRMMAHLGVAPPADAAPNLQTPLRTSLLCCARCPRPEVCDFWLRQGNPGAPLFCSARASFEKLGWEGSEDHISDENIP